MKHEHQALCFPDHGGYFYPHEGLRRAVSQEDECLEMTEELQTKENARLNQIR